jgi:TadE-like protein
MIRRSRKTRPLWLGGRSRRRGMQTLEVVLVLPILLLVSLAIFQFGILVLVQQSVAHAATVTAREAGKGADVDELAWVADQILGPHCITIGDNAAVVLEDVLADPPIQYRGSLACEPPVEPPIYADEVRTTICVDLVQKPFLRALEAYCIDFSGKRFEISSLVKKEALPCPATGSSSQASSTQSNSSCGCGT